MTDDPRPAPGYDPPPTFEAARLSDSALAHDVHAPHAPAGRRQAGQPPPPGWYYTEQLPASPPPAASPPPRSPSLPPPRPPPLQLSPSRARHGRRWRPLTIVEKYRLKQAGLPVPSDEGAMSAAAEAATARATAAGAEAPPVSARAEVGAADAAVAEVTDVTEVEVVEVAASTGHSVPRVSPLPVTSLAPSPARMAFPNCRTGSSFGDRIWHGESSGAISGDAAGTAAPSGDGSAASLHNPADSGQNRRLASPRTVEGVSWIAKELVAAAAAAATAMTAAVAAEESATAAKTTGRDRRVCRRRRLLRDAAAATAPALAAAASDRLGTSEDPTAAAAPSSRFPSPSTAPSSRFPSPSTAHEQPPPAKRRRHHNGGGGQRHARAVFGPDSSDASADRAPPRRLVDGAGVAPLTRLRSGVATSKRARRARRQRRGGSLSGSEYSDVPLRLRRQRRVEVCSASGSGSEGRDAPAVAVGGEAAVARLGGIWFLPLLRLPAVAIATGTARDSRDAGRAGSGSSGGGRRPMRKGVPRALDVAAWAATAGRPPSPPPRLSRRGGCDPPGTSTAASELAALAVATAAAATVAGPLSTSATVAPVYACPCGVEVSIGAGLQCGGPCGRWFHAPCVSLPPDAAARVAAGRAALGCPACVDALMAGGGRRRG
ncbi:hypothetical protein MMPV_003762 [Pyropia vietnamensis]